MTLALIGYLLTGGTIGARPGSVEVFGGSDQHGEIGSVLNYLDDGQGEVGRARHNNAAPVAAALSQAGQE
jgi:hypothetical protein